MNMEVEKPKGFELHHLPVEMGVTRNGSERGSESGPRPVLKIALLGIAGAAGCYLLLQASAVVVASIAISFAAVAAVATAVCVYAMDHAPYH